MSVEVFKRFIDMLIRKITDMIDNEGV